MTRRLLRTFPIAMLLCATLPAGAGVTPRIVGGNDADPGEYPFAAALVSSGSRNNFDGQFCGGAVIADHWILTAAHCVQGETAADIKVVAGTNEMSTSSAAGRLQVDAIVSHPGFNPRSLTNDIALLHLREAAGTPAVAIDDGTLLAGMNLLDAVTAIGWGSLDGGNSFPSDLQEVVLEYIPLADCNTDYYDGSLDTSQLCAGIVGVGGKDTCQGDSGGPLLLNDGGTWRQIGITSFGEDCALPDFPGVYAGTGHFRNWLARIQASTDLAASLTTRGDATGSPVRFTASVRNQSEVAAVNARLAITVPAGGKLSSSDNRCERDGATRLDCAFGDLAAGDGQDIDFEVAVSAAGQLIVSVRALSAIDDYDPNDDLAQRTIGSRIGLDFDGGGGGALLALPWLLLLARRRR
jgi:secreted trypsin-like serine protease